VHSAPFALSLSWACRRAVEG